MKNHPNNKNDKHIPVMTPISRGLDKLFKKISNLGHIIGDVIENLFIDPKWSKIMALIIAIGLFASAQYKINDLNPAGSGEFIRGIPINVYYDADLYSVEGIPETVEMSMVGSQSDILFTKNAKTYEIYVDLEGLGEGTYDNIPIQYRFIDEAITVSLNPSHVSVTIHEQTIANFQVTVDQVNLDALDERLSVSDIKLGIDEVAVKGPKNIVEQVANIKALVDVSIFEEAGVHEVTDIPLVAYDSNGDRIEIDFYPQTLSGIVEISDYNKVIPINVKTIGELPVGISVNNVVVDIPTATIYGNEESIGDLNEIEVEIDVTGLSEETTFTEIINKPVGATVIDVQQVVITVNFAESVEVLFEDIPISIDGISEGLKAVAASTEDSKTDVRVNGVEDIVNTISVDDIKAYTDLTGLEVGEHIVDVYASGLDDKPTYTPVRLKTTIIIIAEDE